MAIKQVNGRVANLSYSSTEWSTLNPVLSSGEIGYESDTGNFKIGDGTSRWNSLSYRGVKEVLVDNSLSLTSGNPVANSVVATKFGEVEGNVTDVTNKVNDLEKLVNPGIVYGFHIDPNESHPSTKVTYLRDAIGLTPAHMNYSTGVFDYGSWENAFFMPRPCMLKYDGTVDYYLDPNNYAYKEDGITESDISNVDYEGNAMMEWGRNGRKIWYSIRPSDSDLGANIYVAEYQVDPTFHAYSFIDSKGNYIDHFYTRIYNGSYLTGTDGVGRLRSLSGQKPDHNDNAQNERTRAAANNTVPTDHEWDIETYADTILINILLTLIGKSTNTQSVFGNGNLHYDESETTYHGIIDTGTMNDKGLFWGSNTSGASSTGVKVFGMENWWANIWQRLVGFVSVNGVKKVKMTYGTQDGSTVEGYNFTGDGYLVANDHLVPNGYVKKMKFNENGSIVQAETGASDSTYYCDYYYTNNDTTTVARRGGDVNRGTYCGAWYFGLDADASYAHWDLGASLSCKPLSLRG